MYACKCDVVSNYTCVQIVASQVLFLLMLCVYIHKIRVKIIARIILWMHTQMQTVFLIFFCIFVQRYAFARKTVHAIQANCKRSKKKKKKIYCTNLFQCSRRRVLNQCVLCSSILKPLGFIHRQMCITSTLKIKMCMCYDMCVIMCVHSTLHALLLACVCK